MENQTTTQINICPICGSQLEHIRLLNEEIFGTKDNPYVGYVCRNEECKGWFCQACEEWHPHGSCCAVAMIRNVRGGNYQEHDVESGCSEKNQLKSNVKRRFY